MPKKEDKNRSKQRKKKIMISGLHQQILKHYYVTNYQVDLTFVML